MSEDKVPPKNQRRGRQERESLEIDEGLSPDEFLAQFSDGDTMLSDGELSEEEFFAAFDRQNNGEQIMFVSDEDNQDVRPQSKSIQSHPSAQSLKRGPALTTRSPKEESDNFSEDVTDEEFEDDAADESDFDDQFEYESESYDDDSFDDQDFDTGDFESEEDPFHLEDDDEVGEDLAERDFDESSFDNEEVSYDLEKKLRLPRRPRRRRRFLEAVVTFIVLLIVFAVAGGMGAYLYAPDQVRPYIPKEYHAYLPEVRIQIAEPALPPGVLDAVMSEPTLKVSPIPEESTPITIMTRQPIEVVEVSKGLKSENITKVDIGASATATGVSPAIVPPVREKPNPQPTPAAFSEPTKLQGSTSGANKSLGTSSPPQKLGNWYVQVSAEPTAAAAEKLKGAIIADGLPGDVYQITIRGRNYYRVVVGPHSKQEAERVIQTLRGKSYIGNAPFLREGK
jgi:cell division septation protein DedD